MTSALTWAGAGLALIAAGFAVTDFVPSGPQPRGHLVLQVEGDALRLSVTRITPKPDPCGPTRIDSRFWITVHDGDGAEIARYPMDLSAFDLDPARVGAPVRTEGDRVIDTRVGALVNIPRHPDARSLTLVRDDRRIGEVAPAVYANLIAAGEAR